MWGVRQTATVRSTEKNRGRFGVNTQRDMGQKKPSCWELEKGGGIVACLAGTGLSAAKPGAQKKPKEEIN